MVFSTCFNGYDAGIMTVILADKQFIDYYDIDDNRSGLVATIPWAMTGMSLNTFLYNPSTRLILLFE